VLACAAVDTPAVYARHSTVTDPGALRHALAGLPRDPGALRSLVPGLVIHSDMGPLYGADLAGRDGEARLRTLRGMLARLLELDPAPLTRPRPADRRLVGNCRASTVLACALLREVGIPARARAGFSGYFSSPIRGDHWVTEWWSAEEGRWRLMDAELDEPLMAENGIAFDPLDVPRDRFVVAGEAWLAIRAGTAEADGFGLNPQVTGAGYVRGQLLRDVAALNMVEVAPWDTWGVGAGGRDPGPADLELLDALAEASVAASAGGNPTAPLWREHAHLRPPDAFRGGPGGAAPAA
jgi:Transglutaminase-like superfamily